MTKVSIVCLAVMLFLGACENNGSSTVGTYENEESTSSLEEKDAVKEEVNNMTEKAGDVAIDTAKSNDTTSNRKDTGILKLNATKAKVKAAKATPKL